MAESWPPLPVWDQEALLCKGAQRRHPASRSDSICQHNILLLGFLAFSALPSGARGLFAAAPTFSAVSLAASVEAVTSAEVPRATISWEFLRPLAQPAFSMYSLAGICLSGFPKALANLCLMAIESDTGMGLVHCLTFARLLLCPAGSKGSVFYLSL